MPILPPHSLATPAQGRPVALADAQSHTNAPAADASALGEQLPDFSPAYYLLLPGVICAVSALIIAISRYSDQIATLWPANAIMVATLLCHKRSLANYASIIIGGSAASALASWLVGNSLSLCAMFMVANGVEVISALVLLSAFQIRSTNLTSFNGVLTFIFIVGGVAPIGSTLICASAYGLAHNIPWVFVWRNWYAGHALGIIILVPFLVSIMSKEWRTLRIKERLSEAVAIVALFVAVSVCAIYIRPIIFVIAPIILLATLRFGMVGATAATFFVAVMASIFVFMNIGRPLFFSQPELSQRIFGLQGFIAITTFWALPAAALLAERDRLLNDLSRANAQLAADSESKSHLVTGLRRHLSMAEENERLRLSHELHDQAGQSLIAAILELNEIDTSTSGAARERLHLVRKRMEEMGKTLHRIAWELRPPSIDELGLRKALASYIAEWGEQCGSEVDFHCDDANLAEVPDEIATSVYRVVQEGLTNIVKHAQRPSNVSVVIRRTDATLQVIIEDNGCGFEVGAQPAKAGNRRGLGLDGMRERLALIGGTLDVESAPGTGTTIFARIALDGRRSAA